MKAKQLSLLFVVLVLCNSKNLVSLLEATGNPTFDKSMAIKDSGKKTFDDSITGKEVIDKMGFGWNLGNTFDAFNEKSKKLDEGLSSETSWGHPVTTEAIIDGVVKKGFKTIRIPVSWHNHLIDDKYTINPQWTSRVKEVVDLSLKKGLYVILNTHHDNSNNNHVTYGNGYYPNNNSKQESEKFLLNIWSQIVLAFNEGYDHHLIFEGLNEPRMRGDTHEWWYQAGVGSCEEAANIVNSFNSLIHSIVRESGGNNAKRFFMVTPVAAAYSYATAGNFRIPDDSKYNPSNKRIFVSAHLYWPYDFAMNPDMSKNKFTDSVKNELDTSFRTLYEKYVSQGYHVIIGEMGIVDKKNLNDRIAWAKYFVEATRKRQMACIVWDNGNWGDGSTAEETFGLYHRSQGTWEPEELVNAYISAATARLG